MPMRALVLAAASFVFAAAPASGDDETTRALNAIKSVSREGKGNDDAGPAWKTLVSKGEAALLPTLAAIDDSNLTAANWLRTAVESIAESEKASGRKLPIKELEAFVTTQSNAAAARALAYELLVSQDPTAKARLLPGFVSDKSLELRRGSIEFQLEKLETTADKSVLKTELEKLFNSSRDKDQVELLAKKLAEVGRTVSITEHFAFITHCALVGPFDSTSGKGFAVHYPPEAATSITGKYTGKADAPVTWKPAGTGDKYGVFDLNKLLDKHKESVAYALAAIVAERETPCDIRVATPNAMQLFLNGKLLCEREEYHHGSPLDANIGKGTLKKGENIILLKLCQNNQKEPWAQSWEFKLRVCDSTGGPLPGIKQRLPENGKTIALGAIPEGITPTEEKK